MLVREIHPTDDIEAIADIYRKSWQEAYRGLVPQDYLDSLSSGDWAVHLRKKMDNACVLLDGGTYAGVSSYSPARDEALSGYGEIISLYLLPAYWGQGAGAALFRASLDALRELGFDKTYLWVLKDNLRARAFYEKHGFAPDGGEALISIGGAALSEVRYRHSKG